MGKMKVYKITEEDRGGIVAHSRNILLAPGLKKAYISYKDLFCLDDYVTVRVAKIGKQKTDLEKDLIAISKGEPTKKYKMSLTETTYIQREKLNQLEKEISEINQAKKLINERSDKVDEFLQS